MNKDHYFSLIILILIVTGALSVIYITINPQPSEKFTEFYVLNQEGRAGNYPVNLAPGGESKLFMVVKNNEFQPVNYRLMAQLDNITIYNEEFTLYSDEKREIPLEFKVKNYGSQKLEMFLYKLPDTNNTYRYLFLALNDSKE